MFTLGKLWLKKPVKGVINITVQVPEHGSVKEQIQNYLRIASESPIASVIDEDFFLQNATMVAIQNGQANLIATMPEMTNVSFAMVETACQQLGYDELAYNEVMQVIMRTNKGDAKTPDTATHIGSESLDEDAAKKEIAAHLQCIYQHIKEIEQLL